MDANTIQVLTYLAAAVVVGLYVVFVVWRLRVERAKKAAAADSSSLAPSARPSPAVKLSRAQRKAAALAGTTPVVRPDIADAEARVLAAAARLAGQEPPTAAESTGAGAHGTRADQPTAEAGEPGAGPLPSLFLPATPPPPAPFTRATVAELLHGIRLPHDLAPLTTMAPRPEARDRVAFITVGPPASVVAPAVAAELERLGFTIAPQGFDLIAVSRGDDHAMVMVHPRGDEAQINGAQAFPTAAPHSVVVEVWVV